MDAKKLNFFELEVFCALRNYSSVRALARAKNLKPSHVSKILSRVESKIDTQLTIRTSSGVKLTQEGAVFLEQVQQLLRQSEVLFAGPRAPYKSKSRKAVNIGGLSYLLKWLVAPLLQTMEEVDSESRYRLVDFSPGTLVSAGIEGAFSLAIHAGEVVWPRTWISRPLGMLEWAVVARKGHPLGPLSHPDAVLSFPFIGPCYWDKRGYVRGNDFCPVPWNKRVQGPETTTADTAAEIVKHSNFLAYLPTILFLWEKNRESLMEVTVEGWKKARAPIYLVAKADQVKERRFQEISSLMKQFIL